METELCWYDGDLNKTGNGLAQLYESIPIFYLLSTTVDFTCMQLFIKKCF